MKNNIIIANWKMNLGFKDSIELAKKIRSKFLGFEGENKVVVCPDFTSLKNVENELNGTNIEVGAQSVSYMPNGAFTGDVSSISLSEVGCKYVIIGHSERRMFFNENDKKINKKIKLVIKDNLIPILCVGENEKEKREGKTKEILENQLRKGFNDIVINDDVNIIVAYEPIWAIGTGNFISKDDVINIYKNIQNVLFDIFNQSIVENNFKIIYGGSITSKNVENFNGCVDGLLVGGASLNAEEFYKIALNFKYV